MQFIGFDIGSSSVKGAIIDAQSGKIIASAQAPDQEMKIQAKKSGWAEQDPETWWKYVIEVSQKLMHASGVQKDLVKSVGISYQMHGLVVTDKNGNVLRPSIIWCDSRAVSYGDEAFNQLGADYCLSSMLNSPGNFTASKLAWVKEHEPSIYDNIDKIMLPGDFIALKMTSSAQTTVSGLSEGIMWDFKGEALADNLWSYFGFEPSFIPEIIPTFSKKNALTSESARLLGLPVGIPVSYRAGDQPNNAFSLNVLEPGEIAATAGTSGVVYAISNQIKFDPKSRVNVFAHVNHQKDSKRLGILLCVNGTGILNNWIRQLSKTKDYVQMNQQADEINPGSDGLLIYPFGNGAERVLENKDPGCTMTNINFNRHHQGHVFRAAQEGIAYGLNYGIEIMNNMGVTNQVIRAGKANLFLSPLFRSIIANTTQARIELFDTDGAAGAARGAALGYGYYTSAGEAFGNLNRLLVVEPERELVERYKELYQKWKAGLTKFLG